MEKEHSYVPPGYIPLGQSDEPVEGIQATQPSIPPIDPPSQWTSGICACCDDTPSCCIGAFCPCYLFGKNAEALGSGTLIGSCVTHFLLWGIVNPVLCCFFDCLLLGVPGCFISFYAASYRRTLRTRYNLQEGPCTDCATHFFCHLCAICQEYREIRDRSNGSATLSPPPIQTMNKNDDVDV